MLYTFETRARMYGGAVACYLWSIYLCDYYQLDLWMSLVCIVLGAGLLWFMYPSVSLLPNQTDFTNSAKDQQPIESNPRELPIVLQEDQAATTTCQDQKSTTITTKVVLTSTIASPCMDDIVDQLGLHVSNEDFATDCKTTINDSTDLTQPQRQQQQQQQQRSPHQRMASIDQNLLTGLVSNSCSSSFVEERSDDKRNPTLATVITLADTAVNESAVRQQRQYTWLVCSTHTLILLGYFVFIGADLITNRWFRDRDDFQAIMGWIPLGTLTIYGLLALSGFRHYLRHSDQGPWLLQQQRQQQQHHGAGITIVDELQQQDQQVETHKEDSSTHPEKETVERYQLLNLNEPCQQYLARGSHPQSTTREVHHAIVRKEKKLFRRGPTAVTLDMIEPSSALLSTMDHVRHEMQVWVLSLFFAAPAVAFTGLLPRDLPSLPQGYDAPITAEMRNRLNVYGKGSMPRPGTNYNDNETLTNNTTHNNNDRMDETQAMMTASAAMTSSEYQYERREQDHQKKSSGGPQKVLVRRATVPLLQTQGRWTASEPSPPPTKESTFARLTRMTMDPERGLSNLFNYYRRQHARTKGPSSSSTPASSPTVITAEPDASESDDDDCFDESDEVPDISFVVRSNTLPTVRVGLYGTSEKRLWTSTGSMINVTAAPASFAMEETTATTTPRGENNEDVDEDLVIVSSTSVDQIEA